MAFRYRKKKFSTAATCSVDDTQKLRSRCSDFRFTGPQRKAINRFLSEFSISGLQKQYIQSLKGYVPPGISRIAFDQNAPKNRYNDVICVDATRVVLHPPGADYIHANYVRDFCIKDPYICTQAPLKNTMIDFWRMIIQERAAVIIMLCDLIEHGKIKCEPYWPDNANTAMVFENIKVECVKKSVKNNVIMSSLRIYLNEAPISVVKHMQWRHWPDRGVPQSWKTPLFLLREARQDPGPTVVHCSAGVGRTGCLVTLDIVLQRLAACENVNLIQLVQGLRVQRAHFVQTDLQLLFLCTCVFNCTKDCHSNEIRQKEIQFNAEFKKILASRTSTQKYTPLIPLCEKSQIPSGVPASGSML